MGQGSRSRCRSGTSGGCLTPAIFWVDKRLGVRRSLAGRVALHVPLGIASTRLSIAIRLVSRPLARQSVAAKRRRVLPRAVPLGSARFTPSSPAWRSHATTRPKSAERERQAHELALQTADLERRLVEARLQSLRAQLQPHFLFNALNTISAFTETNPQTARRLMGQLGDLLRASLTHASRPLVTLGEELTFLDDYLAIESARFEGRITVVGARRR